MSIWDKKVIESKSLYAEVRGITGDEPRNIASAVNNAIYAGHIKPKRNKKGRDYIDSKSFMRWAKSRRAIKWVGKFDGLAGFSTVVDFRGVTATAEVGNVSAFTVPSSYEGRSRMISEQAGEINDLKEEIKFLRNENAKLRCKSEKQRSYAKRRHQKINL